MQKLITSITIILALISTTVSAQSNHGFAGIWKGEIIGISLYFELEQEAGNKLVAFLSIPEQSVDSLAAHQASIIQDSLTMQFSYMGQKISIRVGKMGNDLSGFYRQGKARLPITMSRTQLITPVRLQIPKTPFTYLSKEVSFSNNLAAITLSGTLTIPDESNDYPVIILISGSGLQNRNSEVYGHKPFLVIADYLSSRGIGVYRYDERGAGKSEGAYHSATSINFKNDVLAAVAKLDSMGYKNIGLMGHSEGGLIAPMAAVEDKRIDFIISLAGPALPIDSLMIIQNKMALEGLETFDDQEIKEFLAFTTKVYNLIDIDTPKEELYTPLKELCSSFYNSRDSLLSTNYGASELQFYLQYGNSMLNPWFRWFINYKPEPTIKKLSCPVLALNGSFDVQVTAEPNLSSFRALLAESESPTYKVVELDSLNHLFQKVKTTSRSEYYDSPETFNEEALQLIVEWVQSLEKL